MKNNYNFAAQPIADVTKLISSSTTASVLGIPGAGITLFLKHLSAQPLGHMVYVDVFSLTSFTTVEFYRLLLEKLGGLPGNEYDETKLVAACHQQVELLVTQQARIVICIAGFDQLQPAYSATFFHYLRSLRAVDPTKVVFVFGICRRLDALLPADLQNTDLSLFTSVYYLKPYGEDDLRYLLATYGTVSDLDDKELARLIGLSGGHFQFLQLLLGSERRHDPTQDPFVQLAYKNIFNHLTTTQKSMVRKVALNGAYPKADNYLTSSGIIKQNGTSYELFSELFADCVRAFSAPKLPVKERRLLAVLKRNEGRLVSKRDIYDAVWRGEEVGSEWALNALIYRLRKHPAFTSQNYTIESHKKLGYSLSKDL